MKHDLIAALILLCSWSILNGQELDQVTQKWIKNHSSTISLDEAYRNGDWSDLLKKVKNKRIILLGEFNHGSKEVFQTRNDLIQQLHQQLGFDVVLFESGIGEVGVLGMNRGQLNSQQLTYGFFSGWRTEEFGNLMEYVKTNNITIAGYDVQRTGGAFQAFLKRQLERYKIATLQSNDLERQFGMLKKQLTQRNASFDSLQNPTLRLIHQYDQLLEKLKHENESTSERGQLLRQTLMNRMTYLNYMLAFVNDQDWNKRWAARDLAMAKNIEWLITKLYPNRKVIIVGHNFHIAKHNEREAVMGEFLSPKFGQEMYSLGVFAGKGSFLGNYGDTKHMKPIAGNGLDIKQIIQFLEKPATFIDLPSRSKKGAQWLFQPIIIQDTFIDLSGADQLILAKHFDGLLLLDTVTPATKF